MALIGGESPAYRFLVNPLPPVTEAAIFGGFVVAVSRPARRIRQNVQAGAVILGAASSGLHANGASLVIEEGLKLADGFFTLLPTGRTYGEEALLPCANYVPLVEVLLAANVEILAIVPITGGGIAKLAADRRSFTYRITDWISEYPPLFQYLLGRGVPIADCLQTFNMGIGICFIVPERIAAVAMDVAAASGTPLLTLGHVEEGEPRVIFEPEGGIILPPPGS